MRAQNTVTKQRSVRNVGSQEKVKKQVGGVLLRFLSIASNTAFVFSVLGTIAQLSSWSALLRLLERWAEELVGIAALVSRLLTLILTPWRVVRDYLLGIVPVRLPEDWRDPVLLGLFLVVVPFSMAVRIYFVHDARIHFMKLKRLENLILDAVLGQNRQEDAKELHAILHSMIALQLAFGPIGDLMRGLRWKEFPERLLLDRADRAPKDLEGWRRRFSEGKRRSDEEWRRESSVLFRRAKIVIATLILLELDHAFAGRGLVAFAILWKSILVFAFFLSLLR